MKSNRKLKQIANLMKNPMAKLYQAQIREISPKYENNKTEDVQSFHNYISDN